MGNARRVAADTQAVGAFEGYLAIYGVLALSHLALQMVMAHLEHRRQQRDAAAEGHGSHAPGVTVVVPAFNEDPDTLRRCLDSLRRQDYADLEVIVVDDGSPNQEELLPLYDELSGERFRVLLRGENRGKREAQRVAFDLARGEIVVTVDSDTVLHSPDAIRGLVQRFADERVGAVTGDVAVENRRTNVLTLLIGYRYWSAFHQERAAQSLFGVVMCCSGPFAAYRRSVLDQVKDRYTAQVFRGELCTFGDDRHLTNLVLAEGHRVVFDGRTTAHTAAPTRVRDFLKQQTRWNKSFFRELLWTARLAPRRHPYLMLDLVFQTLLPAMLLIAAVHVASEAVTHDASAVLPYVATIAAIGVVRAGYGMARTRDLGFVAFAVYGLIHMLVLKPVSLYALATLGTTHWGTRSGAQLDAGDPALDGRLSAVPAELPGRVSGGAYAIDPTAIAGSMLRRRANVGLVGAAAFALAAHERPPQVCLG